jgi:TRAP transporter 4TM/12TM fusion protein
MSSTADPGLTTPELRDESERASRRLPVPLGLVVGAVALGIGVYALYSVFAPVPKLQYKMAFLAAVLPLVFVVYPARRHRADEEDRGAQWPNPVDWALAVVAVVACVYPLTSFDAFIRRTFEPTVMDVVMGALVVALVLEATRRTVGVMLPAICAGFLLYAYYGGYLPTAVGGHPGYDLDRIVVQLSMGTEGLYGVPLDVAATYIVLFTIYGAVLDRSGAAKFFVDLAFAAFGRSRTAPGRTVTFAGFLLGTVSGSGTATAISVGSVAWPLLQRAGYPRDRAAGMLAAAGIGAILSPPTLGAAAFIIAEYLRASYLAVLGYALIPSLLYYLGVFLAIETDARSFGARSVELPTPSFWRLLARFGYHFSSLIAIVVFMAVGVTPFRAVVYATALAWLLSYLDPANRLGPRKTGQALAAGVLGVLPIAATCAAAGVIVGVLTLTGSGLRLSGLIVDLTDGSLIASAVLAALAVLLLGLAVPVTASFVIAAVIVGPVLQTLGVGAAEAYMFIFYYAVLSEVTPPTALAAVAAAAITGGNPFRSMMQTWKYTLPAFLVPFAIVLSPAGAGLLGQGSLAAVAAATAQAALAVLALAIATGGWVRGPAGPAERLLAGAAAVLLLALAPVPGVLGLGLLIATLVLSVLRRPSRAADLNTGETTS